MNPLFPSSIISKAVAAHKPISIPSAKEAKYDMMYYLRAALAGGICCGITHGMHPHHAVYLQTIAFTHTGSTPALLLPPGPLQGSACAKVSCTGVQSFTCGGARRGNVESMLTRRRTRRSHARRCRQDAHAAGPCHVQQGYDRWLQAGHRGGGSRGSAHWARAHRLGILHPGLVQVRR